MASDSVPDTPMEILSSYICEIRTLAAAENVSQRLQTLIEKAANLVTGHDTYLEQITSPESETLKQMAAHSDGTDWDQLHEEGKTLFRLPKECLTGHVEGQFMKTLVALTGARRVLEVGMFTAYCSMAMAEALPPDGHLVTLELEPHLLQFVQPALRRSPHGHKINVQIGPAQESLLAFAKEKHQFDIIFIDADKTGYHNYYKVIMDNNLLAKGGALVIDNALFKGSVYLEPQERDKNGHAVAEFNEYVRNDQRTEQVLVPLRDGVLIIRHKDTKV